jgi:hypothetical protein
MGTDEGPSFVILSAAKNPERLPLTDMPMDSSLRSE